MAGYDRGKMDISGQSATFSSFMKLTMWSCGLIAVSVLFLSLTFTTDTGWFTAMIISLVAGGLIGLALRLSTWWYVTLGALAVVTVISGLVTMLAGALLN